MDHHHRLLFPSLHPSWLLAPPQGCCGRLSGQTRMGCRDHDGPGPGKRGRETRGRKRPQAEEGRGSPVVRTSPVGKDERTNGRQIVAKRRRERNRRKRCRTWWYLPTGEPATCSCRGSGLASLARLALPWKAPGFSSACVCQQGLESWMMAFLLYYMHPSFSVQAWPKGVSPRSISNAAVPVDAMHIPCMPPALTAQPLPLQPSQADRSSPLATLPSCV